MPSFNPFTSVTGRHAYTLFEIRLENDFIVFHGNEHESSGQFLKGTVVLCLPHALRVEDVHLRLTGTRHLAWIDTRMTASGVSNQKIDKSTTILNHRWKPFVGIGSQDESHSSASNKAVTLPAGNYEWPFEFMLPGDTCESVEGISEANVTYKLKATVARGKLAYDLHAYKRFRVIRTLESSALEFLHAMSVENIWPNKVEYSIVIPQKAVVFGSEIPLETRFTPLLKGLEMGDVQIKLVEIHELILHSYTGHALKEHKKEREVATWTVPVNREEHWQDMIEDSGQEGWVMHTTLDLPRKLGKCLQDVDMQGIKIRHKLKLVIALKNPDGHVSELRATLPVTIFISPNLPLDDEGNLLQQAAGASAARPKVNTIAPPGYGEHILDQLYDDVDPVGLMTPMPQSGMNSPFYGQSRAGSSENLAALLANSTGVTAAALSSRLQNMALDPSHRNTSWNSMSGLSSGAATPYHITDSRGSQPHSASHSAPHSPPPSNPLSRQNSDEHSPGLQTPEPLDYLEMSSLSKVPSYQTAVKTRPHGAADSSLPDYLTAMSAPVTPAPADSHGPDPMETIDEVLNDTQSSTYTRFDGANRFPSGRRPNPRRRQTSLGFSALSPDPLGEEERRRLQQLQQREHAT